MGRPALFWTGRFLVCSGRPLLRLVRSMRRAGMPVEVGAAGWEGRPQRDDRARGRDAEKTEKRTIQR